MLDFVGNKRETVLFAAPGARKTRVFLETIAGTEGRTLVVAPQKVCAATWPHENAKWGYKFPMRFLHGKNKRIDGNEHVSLINYEGFEWLAEALKTHKGPFPWKQIIFDELSRMKNVATGRWRAIEPWLPHFKYRLGGTGTPTGNHLLDIFGEVAAVDLGKRLGQGRKDVREGFDRFKRRFFYESEYSYDITPLDGAEAEIMNAIRDVALAIDIDQIPGMPEISHIRHDIVLPEAARCYYEELHKHNAVDDLDVEAVNAAVVSGKSRQIASGAVYDVRGELRALHTAKADQLKLLVDELQGSPALVFFEFKHDLEAIRKALGNVPAINGGTPARQVPLLVRQWNAGELPVLALHPRSAAYGLNMQEGPGRTMIWYTVPWSGELVNQGIARLWRQGQQRHVMCHYLLVTETEDERVYDVVQSKAALHDRVMTELSVK